MDVNDQWNFRFGSIFSFTPSCDQFGILQFGESMQTEVIFIDCLAETVARVSFYPG